MKILIDGPDQILYQWDKGQRLMLHGADAGTRVDFARCDQHKAVSVYAYAEDGAVFCDIPDSLLMDPNHLHGYVYEIYGDRGETVREFMLPVIRRPMPEDYVAPDEVLTWSELEERISVIEREGVSDERIAQAVNDYLDENPVQPGGSAGTVEIVDTISLPPGSEPTATETEDSTPGARKYVLGIPDGTPGRSGSSAYASVEEVDGKVIITTSDAASGVNIVEIPAHRVVVEPDLTGVVKSVNGKTPDENGNVEIPVPDSSQNGNDGFSPVATVTQTSEGATISITDKNGTTTATIANGKDGRDGQDGYTPAKGVDYFDGVNGADGKDGYTPQKGIDYFDGEDGQDGNPGKDGVDGVSVTHEWNGTVLQVTSASGTSSADLKGEPGHDGSDGTSPVVSVSAITGGHRITITDKNGTKTVDVLDGSDGKDGKDGNPGTNGQDGNGIKSAVLNADYTLTLAFDDGTSYTTPSIRGATGATGAAGKNGANGADGKTPVKGVDYWTEADQESIVQQVITALGTPVFGTVDADNNIILTGNLADGTYTLKYEDADGEQIEIGTVEIGGIAYTNLLPLAIGCDGSIQKDRNGNAVGYADGAYLTGNGSNPWQNASYVNDSTTHFVTGFIPYTKAQAEAGVPIYVKGVTMDTATSHTRAAGYNSYSDYTAYHDPVKFSTGKITVEELGTAYYKLTPTADFVSAMASSNAGSNFAYIRFSFPGSGSGTIITVGEPIE